ncbi:potassium voltage-gated channel subfamily S member 2 isoform X2 [Labeo rohita]|uniref:potassium voltage-gated channel subfamily S member 2 isoform X2 n=1 Tax=Labeo rohita TaxID=84645 RepID=UPI0021E2DFC1|nr:potassium voltage-gated channel subfamily S member 2 isoform X2 [Labeo rohita]
MVKERHTWWILDPKDNLLHINVGGLRHTLCSSILRKFPDTRLGQLLSCDSEDDILLLCDDFDVQQKECYFDRNPGLFPYVLHFYQTGKLHIMEELCIFSFSQEIEYWGISEFFLDSCCSYRYLDRKLGRHHKSWDEESDASSVDTSVDEISDLNKDIEHFHEMRFGNIRKCLWLTLENPGIPEYQIFDENGNPTEDPTMHVLEVFCICWFTFEVVTRMLLAPNHRKFFLLPLNVIDIISVMPIYITLFFDLLIGSESELDNLGKLVQVLRLMRIFRVLKLARHSTGLRSLGATLRHSYREVGILLLYLAVGVSVFSGMAYTAEYEEDVGLDTIPACWWWGTVSMTTVGYGDVVPVTVAGKLAASGCILSGTLVVALPITIIFNKFSHFYRKQKALEASVRNSNNKRLIVRQHSNSEDIAIHGHSNCLEDGEKDEDVSFERGIDNFCYEEHPLTNRC